MSALCLRLILPPSEASTSDELEHSFQVRFLNLDIEATCEGDPDIMEVQPVRNTDAGPKDVLPSHPSSVPTGLV